MEASLTSGTFSSTLTLVNASPVASAAGCGSVGSLVAGCGVGCSSEALTEEGGGDGALVSWGVVDAL